MEALYVLVLDAPDLACVEGIEHTQLFTSFDDAVRAWLHVVASAGTWLEDNAFVVDEDGIEIQYLAEFRPDTSARLRLRHRAYVPTSTIYRLRGLLAWLDGHRLTFPELKSRLEASEWVVPRSLLDCVVAQKIDVSLD